jgi:hypothetical protein
MNKLNIFAVSLLLKIYGCLMKDYTLITRKILYVNFYPLKINDSVTLQILISTWDFQTFPKMCVINVSQTYCPACLLFDDDGNNITHELFFLI